MPHPHGQAQDEREKPEIEGLALWRASTSEDRLDLPQPGERYRLLRRVSNVTAHCGDCG